VLVEGVFPAAVAEVGSAGGEAFEGLVDAVGEGLLLGAAAGQGADGGEGGPVLGAEEDGVRRLAASGASPALVHLRGDLGGGILDPRQPGERAAQLVQE
jgi:hypothetical protein